MSADIFKQQAAYYAVDTYAQSGMILGLGMGSTAIHAVRRIAEHLHSGRLENIWGVPCGLQTEQAARELGIPLATLDEQPRVDVTFDGADEVDPHLNLIKGGGGALLREKIVAQASAQEIILVDQSKLVPVLGTQWALPIEVMAFGLGAHRAFLESLGGQPKLRLQANGQPFLTDQGNYILDTQFGLIPQPAELSQQLKAHAGIVEHGLFIQLATTVIVSGAEGLQVLTPPA